MPTIKLLQNWRDFQSGEVTDVLNEVVCAAWVDAGIATYTTGTDVQVIEAGESEEEPVEVLVPHRGPGRPRMSA